MLFYYSSCPFRSAEYKYAPFPEYNDRTDQLSFSTVSRTVENFIASGRSVTSLRQVSSGLSEANNTDIKAALDTELTAFDRNPYGIDLAEASMEIKRLNALADKKESDLKRQKELESLVKSAKEVSGKPSGGVPANGDSVPD